MNNKRYQLWEFTTTGEHMIAQSNNIKYLKNKAENNSNAIYLYIYDIIENKTIKKYP